MKDLRWKRPKAPVYRDGINATQQPVACMQLPDVVGFGDRQHAPYGVSEDCLTLSVLRPEGTKPNDRLPVMVYLYGGRFFQGSGAVFNSPTPVVFGQQTVSPRSRCYPSLATNATPLTLRTGPAVHPCHVQLPRRRVRVPHRARR